MNNCSLDKFRIGLFSYFLFLYIITVQGIQSGDNIFHYQRVQNILRNHSLSMPEGKYDLREKRWLQSWMKEGKDGRIYLILPDGLSIATVPFALFGNLIEKTGNYDKHREKMNEAWKNGNIEKEIFHLNKLPSASFSVMINPLVMALTMLIFFNFCYLLTNSVKKALISSILLGNATILWVYSSSYWTQPIVSFCLFAAFYFLYRFRSDSRINFLIFAGILTGYSYITRYPSVLSLPFFIFYIIGSNGNNRRKKIKYLVFFSIPLFVFLFIQMYWNYYRFGSPFDLGVFRLPFTPRIFLTYLTGMLFSLSRSIFVFSPPLILGLFGLRRFFRDHRLEVVVIVGIPFVFLIFYSLFGFGISLIGTAWGPRYLVPIVPFLLLPVCIFLNRNLWIRMLTIVIFIIGLFIQFVAVFQPFRGDVIGKYFGRLTPFNIPFLKTEIIPQARMLFKGGFHLWMFESIQGLIIGLILSGCCLYSLWYCLYAVTKSDRLRTET